MMYNTNLRFLLVQKSPRGREVEVIRGNVMATFSLTFVYQRKREFAREILTVFNSAHFRPVRIYFYKKKTDFIGNNCDSLCLGIVDCV